MLEGDVMKRFYFVSYCLSINGDLALPIYTSWGKSYHYGDIPENECITFTDVKELKEFIADRPVGHFYNGKKWLSNRSYIRYDDDWSKTYTWYDDKFKEAKYTKMHKEVDLSNQSAEFLMKNLCAEDFAAWLKDNGIANCPIISK